MSIYFEGNTPYMTAFAIIAIESVWPNPEGGELTSDSYDMSLLDLGEQDRTYGRNPGVPRGSFSGFGGGGAVSSDDYHREQGYYKIIPLNILSARTTTTPGGSNFEIKFTLDDLLLITDEGNSAVMSNATGLPLNRADLASLDDVLPMFRPSRGLEYVRDEGLGLARYRITGPNSGFNLEDLVTENDTVTIWLYHDPKEFHFRSHDLDVVRESPAGNDPWPLVELNQDMSWVIGSGDRRGQYSTEEPDFKESVLGRVGLINDYREASLQSSITGEEKPQVAVTYDNVYRIIDAFYMEARSGVPSTTVDSAIDKFSRAFFAENGNEDTGRRVAEWVLNPVAGYTFTEDSSAQLRERRELLRTFIEKLKQTGDSQQMFELTQEAEQIGLELVPAMFVEGLVHGINLFASGINAVFNDHVENSPNKEIVTRARQNFSNGRTILMSGDGKSFHGETPYLALKGQISGVKVSVGAVQGAHTVTISGKGFEKILQEHEVYYESNFLSDSNKPLTDYQYFFVHMSPPRAVLSIVNSWAPKKIIMGKPTAWSVDSYQLLWRTKAKPNPDDVEEGESEVPTEDDQLPMPELVPLRGNLVLEQKLEGMEIEKHKLRLFTPLNYIDTTRVREMAFALERAYTDPEKTAGLNTAKPLQSKVSVMQNLTNIIGVGQLYEIFVDETGRLRYRLTFEAMERTPSPIYTPIIQDRDLFSDGSSFEHSDAELKTLIDVSPLRGSHTAELADIAWKGRSVPSPSPIPLVELPEDVDPASLSADLFRYGLRTTNIDDVYTSESNEARRKAIIYRGFFGRPIKKATLKIRGNTSYRMGETVLVALQRNKHRTRTVIHIQKMLDWLKRIKDDEDLLDMYIGVDERLLHPEYYNKTTSFNPLAGSDSYLTDFVNTPKKFVAEQFIATFEYLQETLPGVEVITPEYFPSTYWFAKWGGLAAQGWDQNSITQEDILAMHTAVLRAAVLGDEGAMQDVRDRYLSSPGLINMLKFQDFRCASYYISGVTHNFTQDSDASTSLNLTFGQDNLVLLEPAGFAPVGFISLEKKMRIGYDDEDQKFMYEDFESQRSGMQDLYIEQFKEDQSFKRGNFLYTAQTFRNTANYMYELALERGMDVEYPADGSVDRDVYNEVPRTVEQNTDRINEVANEYQAERDAAIEARRERERREQEDGTLRGAARVEE